MKKISRKAFLRASGLLAAAALSTGLTGCGGGQLSSGSEAASSGAAEEGGHAPLHLLTAGRDYTQFLALLHSRYPEIRVELDAYYGQNRSAYTRRQLTSGILPDIYSCTYFWSPDRQAEYLIDLSRYPVSDLYHPMQMQQTDVDGATYLLPYDFSIQGIWYNSTLFQRMGWQPPEDLDQMLELLPRIAQAGMVPSLCQMNLPGLAFQQFCAVSDTVFLNTRQGRIWQEKFLAGQAGTDALQESAELFQRWIDCGLLNMEYPDYEVDRMSELFRQGNTAFFVGSLDQPSQNGDGTGDQYALLPYPAPDSTGNTYVIKTSRFYGLSRELENPGNEQKLEDALHLLEVLSTPEGFESIAGGSPSSMSPLSGFALPEDSPYSRPLAGINAGHSAPFLYAGWEDYVASFGNTARRWINGELDARNALHVLNDLQAEVLARGGAVVYTTVTEELDTLQTAQLVGKIFLQAAGADAALISCNEPKPGIGAFSENVAGVSGHLLPGPMTEEDIVAYLPTGWYDTIYTIDLSGAQLKELAAEGYDRNGNGDTYPYAFVTADGVELQDGQLYTTVLCGATKDVWKQNRYRDTGIVGLDAAKAFFRNRDTISSALLA